MDFYEKEDFSREVFTVESGKIVTHKLENLCREYTEECCSPRGVEPIYHCVGNELRAWGKDGKARTIETFNSPEEADHAMLLCFRQDLLVSDNAPYYHDEKEEANKERLAYIIC